MDSFIWIGICFCLSQSAIFSGLNLALLGLSRLRLEVETESGNKHAHRILALRKDSNFLLTTILWGNVAVNTLLTLLSDSVLTGVGAFLFATVGITIFGEILPQAYFSRNALRVGALLAPVIRFYQILLFPVAKPTALLLDWWLGKEGITFMREREMRHMLQLHMDAHDADLGHVEGIGALNFLELDDLEITTEGEPINPLSIIELPVGEELPLFPEFERIASDPFLQQVQASGEKWVVIIDAFDRPRLALNADSFLRTALFESGPCNPYAFCHRPIVVEDGEMRLSSLLRQFHVDPVSPEDDVVDLDMMLLWTAERRILTGADLLGRLLRGIAGRPRHAALPG